MDGKQRLRASNDYYGRKQATGNIVTTVGVNSGGGRTAGDGSYRGRRNGIVGAFSTPCFTHFLQKKHVTVVENQV